MATQRHMDRTINLGITRGGVLELCEYPSHIHYISFLLLSFIFIVVVIDYITLLIFESPIFLTSLNLLIRVET